jgi:hypothetical protein
MGEWQRSSFCADSACVEVKRVGDVFMLRDSKRPEVLPLRFTLTEWVAFLRGVQAGEFGIDA